MTVRDDLHRHLAPVYREALQPDERGGPRQPRAPSRDSRRPAQGQRRNLTNEPSNPFTGVMMDSDLEDYLPGVTDPGVGSIRRLGPEYLDRGLPKPAEAGLGQAAGPVDGAGSSLRRAARGQRRGQGLLVGAAGLGAPTLVLQAPAEGGERGRRVDGAGHDRPVVRGADGGPEGRTNWPC